MVRLPILRAGREYRSLTTLNLPDVATGECVAEVSLANSGLVARDLRAGEPARRALAGIPSAEMVAICRRAAARFATAELPLGDGVAQSPEDYVRQVSSTTGLPRALARMNMEKIRFVLDQMERVLRGFTRGLNLKVLDSGFGEQDGRTVSYVAQTDALGAILPSNSPGVHSLWVPSIALKVPVILKPGRQEPWTPLRVARALQAAGGPEGMVSYYPTDHAGAAEILLRCGRSMLFGEAASVAAWRDDPRVQIHGPGFSKVLLDEDAAASWESHLDVMVQSIAENGGRSCLNASGVWTPSRGRAIAEGLATRLVKMPALPLDDPAATLAAFPDPRQARALSDHIDRLLRVPGAEDVTARMRGGGRVAETGGCTFLLPTVVRCDDPEHPLASCEFLFPFASVVESPREGLTGRIGPTLVATAITRDDGFRQALLACRTIDRLNLGPIPTSRVSWDQPHEGNLFEHLYRQRAVQAEAAPAAGA